MVQRLKILVVTSLYPEDDSDTENTRAIHNFVRFWQQKADVLVIRPCFINPKRNRYWPRRRRTTVEGIRVYHVPTLVSMGFATPWGPFPLQFSFSVGLGFLDESGFVPDVVVSHMRPAHVLGYQLATRYAARYVMALHGSDLLWPIAQVDRYARKSDLIVCRSPSIARQVTLRRPRWASRIFVANSGIDAREILDEGHFERKARSWGAKTRIISVTRLVKLKHLDVVLRALAQLSELDWEYTLIGDGPEGPRLRLLASQLGIGHRVRFLGFRPRGEVMKALPDAEVFVMPSAPETFGLAYLEAMAKGCVPICAQGWGIDGLVQSGTNGYTVPAGDVDSLKTVFVDLFQAQPSQKQALLRSVFQTISELTEDAVSQQYFQRLAHDLSSEVLAQ